MRGQWWEFGNKSIIFFHHSSLGFRLESRFRCCKLTCHQTGIWLWERLLWKQSISGSWKFFYCHALYKHSWLHLFDAASTGVEPYILPKNYSASWMVQRLRIGHPQALLSSQEAVKTQTSMSYIFLLICMFSEKACSFICRSLTLLCTWMHFLSFVGHAITQTIGIALNKSMQSPGKITKCHMQRQCCVMPWWL